MTLRITPDGRICGLWTDEISLCELGPVSVRRASHVEFDDRRQCWFVREAEPESAIRRWLQRLLAKPMGHVLHRAATRHAALEWEHEYFQPGAPGWRRLIRNAL